MFRAIILFVFVATASAEPSQGLNALPQVEFSRLSQPDPNPLGAKALAIRSQDWKHGETDHFIYHFVHSYVATPISIEAEFYYRVVTRELQKETAPNEKKSHIYIFERPEDWEIFQSAGQLEPWTGGIQSEGSLFIVRDPSFKFADNSLGHEIAHLLLQRFYGNDIPRWLNEGFAQYVSKGAHASFRRARGYLAKPHSEAVASDALFPIAALTTMIAYPTSNQVETFYDESERLVRFLAATDKPSFLALLDALAHHEKFETAVSRTYAGKFANLSALEEKFREYAAKDSGSSLQDR